MAGGFLFGICSACCGGCQLCCFASQAIIDWRGASDNSLSEPDGPLAVSWSGQDAACPWVVEDGGLSITLDSIYFLSVIEGDPNEYELQFYCGSDASGAGDFLAVTVLDSDVTWQTVNVGGTDYRRPHGTATLQIDSSTQEGVSCVILIEFDAEFVWLGVPGRALATLP